MTSRGDVSQDIVVRFAPSPNGLLHLGHAYAAIQAFDYARAHGGRMLLRIEDIDAQRSKSAFVTAIMEDLEWLGLEWDGPPVFQSQRLDSYAEAAKALEERGLLYPCFCSRSDLRSAQERTGLAKGPDGPIYSGTCRDMPRADAERKMAGNAYCWRLDVAKATAAVARPIEWHDARHGVQTAAPELLGDVVIIPKQSPTSYHLAVTVDDARDRISHVVRGDDLFASTHVHRLLQALLDLPTPDYVHHPLLLDETGSKLSKSRDSASLAVLRKAGLSGISLAQDMRKEIFPVGITLTKD